MPIKRLVPQLALQEFKGNLRGGRVGVVVGLLTPSSLAHGFWAKAYQDSTRISRISSPFLVCLWYVPCLWLPTVVWVFSCLG